MWAVLLGCVVLHAWPNRRADWRVEQMRSVEQAQSVEHVRSVGSTALQPESAPPSLTSGTGLRFPCLSYAPFRRAGWQPGAPDWRVPVDALRRDLAHIARFSSCVRLYGSANGLDAVPALARELGLRVWLGVWLGSDLRLNALEIERALRLIEQEGDVVDRIIVGSEVLLRGELTVTELVRVLQDVQAQTTRPVAYADVWEFWLQHADALSPHVDEALIHILPYWENTPVGLPLAVDHVFDVWQRAWRVLAPLPVIIGETGWPAVGRARGSAQPGLAAQSDFIAALLARLSDEMGGANRPLVNVIEAFNQPWKAQLEGVAGAGWGVLDAPVLPARVVWVGVTLVALAGLSGGMALIGMAGGRWRVWRLRNLPDCQTDPVPVQETTGLQPMPFGVAIGFAALATAWSAVLLFQPVREWTALDLASPTGLWRCAGLVLFSVWSWLECAQLTLKPAASLAPLLRGVRAFALWVVAGYSLVLVADGRYVDLAWPLLALPTLPWALRVWVLGHAEPRGVLATARSGLMAGSAVAIVQVEGWGNSAAVSVALLVLAMALTAVKQNSADSV